MYVRKCVKVPIYNFVVTDTIISCSNDYVYVKFESTEQ